MLALRLWSVRHARGLGRLYEFLARLAGNPDFRSGNIDTALIARNLPALTDKAAQLNMIPLDLSAIRASLRVLELT